MKIITFGIALSCTLFFILSESYGQDKVGEIFNATEFNVKGNSDLLIQKDPTHSFVNCLYVFDKEEILALEFNNDYQTITNHTYINPNHLKFPNLLGGVYTDKKSVLVYTKGRNQSFNVVSVNNQRKFLVSKEIEISKDEIFLESFGFGKYYYLVTVGSRSSYLVFYKIDTDLKIETYTVDLSEITFGVTEKGLYRNLLTEGGEKRISNVSYETINSLATTASRNKIYVFDNTFNLTIDKNFGQTLILRVNLLDWSKSFKKVALKSDHCKQSKSNSFLFYKWLFKSQICNDQLRLSVFDYETGIELTNFVAGSEEEISFKNTQIIQKGGKTMLAADSRELSKTSSLIRKILNSEISIAVNATNSCESCFEVTLGSFEEWEVAPGAGPGIGPSYIGGTYVTLGGTTTRIPGTFSPTYSGYAKGTLTKSAFFKSLLRNDNFSHILGYIEKNSFERIESFTDSIESIIITKTVFFRNGQYYLAYYSKDSKSFVIMKF